MGSSFYRSFEERHRGSVEDIKSRLSFYLPFLSRLKEIYPDGVIADIGCGRGEWLEILTENGIANIGVDLDDGMLARAKEAGLNVQKMDCLQFLQNQADQSLIALTGFHIAEHLPFEVLQQLVMHTLRVLKPGGLLILETPNPENVSVGTCSFYMDPTHNHPLPPPLLEFLPIHYGFKRAITVRLQEKEALKSPDAAVNLIDVLKGVSPDYSIIAQKAAPEDILEGFEKSWNYVGRQRMATYTNLPKGHYVFKVRSTNADGVWTENTRLLDIEVLPSFWETSFAYFLYVVFILLIIITAVYILFTIYRLKHKVSMEQQMTDMKLRFFTDISHELRTPLY